MKVRVHFDEVKKVPNFLYNRYDGAFRDVVSVELAEGFTEIVESDGEHVAINNKIILAIETKV